MDIDNIEQKMGVRFPKELKEYFLQNDVRIIRGRSCDYKIFTPEECAQIRMREGLYENNKLLDNYKKYEQDALIFMEIDRGVYLSMGFSDNKIYFADRVVQEDLGSLVTYLKYNDII